MLKLYYANICLLRDAQVFEHNLEKVNTIRKEKVFRCRHEKDKKRSLLAGILFRQAIEREGMVYEKLSVSSTANGKPVLLEPLGLYFSLSHAGEYAACVISDHSVGVDLETREKMIFQDGKSKELERLAQKIMTPEEGEQFKFASKEEKIELFLQFWTRKESYSKADGRGLAMGVNQVDTNTEDFYSQWLDKDTLLSIFAQDESFSDLQIEEITNL